RDGLEDGEEINDWGSNPLTNHTDTYSLTDWEEVVLTETDPTTNTTYFNINDDDWDSDSDGLGNLEELRTYGTLPLDPDSDNDDLLDGEEILIGTDPLNDDTDGDLLHDGDEIHIYGTNPLSIDTDGDELTDTYELTINTNATNPVILMEIG
ncbi:MAG: hypothetical protein ACXABF_03145, partial [Candidatus Thorarchaeota archaeon]